MRKALYNLLFFWVKVSRQYDLIKRDPEKSAKSVKLGVTSLLMSIIGIGLTTGFAYLAFLCLAGLETLAFFLAFIGIIVCIAAAIGCFVELVLASIVYAAYQMKLNKKPVGLAALIVSLLISIATIVLVIVVLMRV